MNVKQIIFIIGIVLLFTGCMKNDRGLSLGPNGNESPELVKLSARGDMDQQPSNQAKQIISNYEEVTGVRAVNHDNQLVVAVEIDHGDRFRLDDIERELKKEIKRNFSKMTVTLSTDQKLLLELRNLENDIQANNISKNAIKKRLHELKKLSEEET